MEVKFTVIPDCDCGKPGKFWHECPFNVKNGTAGEYECNCCDDCVEECAAEVPDFFRIVSVKDE